MHHAGGSLHREEPECVADTTLGGSVHIGEPDDGPDVGADNPTTPDDAEPDDAAQVGSDDARVDSPHRLASFPEDRRRASGSGYKLCSRYGLRIPDLDSDDSEYGSYFYASIDMLAVERLVPHEATGAVRNSCFLDEESMSEPSRILVYHEWLLANQWRHVRCISG